MPKTKESTMEVRILLSSLSIGLGSSGFGVNAITGSYIQTRVAPDAPVKLFGIADSMSLGSDSGTLLASHVTTSWFKVDSKAEKILAGSKGFVGNKAQLEISGTLISSGKTDVKLTSYNKAGSGTAVFELIDIPSSGGQLASSKIRGIVKSLPGKKPKIVNP